MIDPRLVSAYEQYADNLIAYATVVAGAKEAEDIVSGAMLSVFTSTKWDSIDNPKSYLFRCVFNEAMGRGRRASQRPAKEKLSQLLGASNLHSDQVLDQQQVDHSLDSLDIFAALSTRERAVIYLTYWEDLHSDDVAKLLDITPGAVKRYLARARKKLRNQLQEQN